MCTLYLLTPSSPILLSGCDNIKFAPFNSSYPTIREDARATGISDSLNQWDKPIVVTQNQSINGPLWSPMDPKQFSLITVPVEIPPSNKSAILAGDLINKANVGDDATLFTGRGLLLLTNL